VFLRLAAKVGDRFIEQRIDFQSCVKFEKYASGACANFSETCGEESMKMSSAFELHKRFKEGRENVDDDDDDDDNVHHFLR
jgi:hypothetical protein